MYHKRLVIMSEAKSLVCDKWNIYKWNGIFINGIFPATSINKGCHSHQWLRPSNVSWWALRKLRAENNTCHLAANSLQPLPMVSAKETMGVKIQAPDSWGAYQRDDFSEPRLLHLPIHRKALNSLTWDIWFPYLTILFWHSQLPALCCKTPTYPGSFSSPHQSSFSVIWNAVSRTAVLILPQIKLNSQLSRCTFFFFKSTVMVTTKGPRVDFSLSPELCKEPEPWYQQRLLAPIRR